jgi:hypothetical protein
MVTHPYELEHARQRCERFAQLACERPHYSVTSSQSVETLWNRIGQQFVSWRQRLAAQHRRVLSKAVTTHG